jgi:MFS family permease
MTVQTQDTSHARLPREVRVLIVARVVNGLGGFTLVFLPVVLVSSYGASLRNAGLVVAGFGLATIPSRLFGGWLTDRIGRRRTIVVGLTGCAAAQVGVSTAPELVAAAVAAVALGLCFEIYETPSQALVADLVPEEGRAAAYSALGAALSAAAVVAGLLAALLAGVGLRWLFLFDAATCLACASLIWFTLPDLPIPPPTGDGTGRSPWRDGRLLTMLGAATVFGTLYLTMAGGLPLALRQQGIAVGWAGILIAVSAVTVVAAQRWRHLLTGRSGDAIARMRVGFLLLGLGLALAALAATVSANGWSYVPAVVVWSLGDVILLGEPYAVVTALCAPADRGRYLAAYGISWGFAAMLAPLVSTRLLAIGGPATLWLACAFAALLLGAAQSWVRRRTGSPDVGGT